MPRYRYTVLKKGRTRHPTGVRALFRDLAEYLLRTGDLELALNHLLLTGVTDPDGEQLLPGMSDLLAQVRKVRGSHLLRYSKEPLLEQLRERLRLLAGGGSTLGLDGVSVWESRLRTGAQRETEEGEEPAALARCLMRLGLSLRQPGPLLPKMIELCSEAVREAQKRALLDASPCQAIEAVLAACDETYSLQAFLERNNFVGREPLSHEQAMELMDLFRRLDELERSMRALSWGQPLEQIDASALHSLLGQEATVVLRRLASIRGLLEEAGLLTRRAGELRLTAQGISRIGQQVLEEIFSALGKRRFASKTDLQGEVGTERTEETRPFQDGDPFAIAVGKSLLNAVRRGGAPGGVRLRLEDLEVFQPDQTSDTATALLLDMSWSMAERDRFYGAKKVALALHTLLRRRFPRDALHIVGFYDHALRIAMADLPYAKPYEGVPGTNMQEAFRLSADLLRRERASNKQIILISDGEPNAYIRSGQVFFQQPPSRDAVEETLREVERCTRTEIVINTFMLNDEPEAASFVERLTRINKGRAFYADPDNLGEYLLVNYLEGTRRRIESAGRKGSLHRREGLSHKHEHVAH